MALLKKRFSQKGYNVLEFTLLLIIIMGGIIIMGPTVIRSVNANIKGWDDSVKDSQTDPLASSPPIIIPGCDCSWIVGDCGPVTDPGTGITCPLYTHIEVRVCIPGHCAPGTDVQCIIDDACCDNWSDTGLCGVNAVPNGTGPGGVCPNGQMLQIKTCGSGLSSYRCVPNPACIFSCNPPVVANGTFCPNDTTDLPSTLVVVNVPDAASCTDAQKCEVYCNHPSLVYWPLFQQCACPDINQTFDGIQCVCNPGFILRGACGAGQCETPASCFPGDCAVY